MTDRTKSIRLIDLMSLMHPLWHTRQKEMERDPDILSRDCITQVLGLLEGRHGAVAMDTKPTRRLEIFPDYKAGREEKPAPFLHQIAMALHGLAEQGVPVWSFKGHEADDVIGSAVMRLIRDDEAISRGIQIVSQDKDLMQLVNDECGVTQLTLSIGTGADVVYDEAAVTKKFGVPPHRVADWLCLVGDKADNIEGAKGIGPKRAAELLRDRSLGDLMAKVRSVELPVTPAQRTALLELERRLDVVQWLVTLECKLDVEVDQVWEPRVAAAASDPDFAPAAAEGEIDDRGATDGAPVQEDTSAAKAAGSTPASPPTAENPENGFGDGFDGNGRPKKILEPEVLDANGKPVAFERQLECRNLGEARQLSKWIFDARMFEGYGSPQAVLTTVLTGRELGMATMASLRAIHIVEGRHALSADLMVALALKTGVCEYFQLLESSDEVARFETKRKGTPKPTAMKWTIEQAKRADLVKQTRNNRPNNWMKFPDQMLRARCKADLVRLVYPDLLMGLYTPEELEADD